MELLKHKPKKKVQFTREILPTGQKRSLIHDMTLIKIQIIFFSYHIFVSTTISCQIHGMLFTMNKIIGLRNSCDFKWDTESFLV